MSARSSASLPRCSQNSDDAPWMINSASRVQSNSASFGGFLTSAAKRGASIFKMMDVSRHRSVDALRGYVRDAEIFKDHAGAGLL